MIHYNSRKIKYIEYMIMFMRQTIGDSPDGTMEFTRLSTRQDSGEGRFKGLPGWMVWSPRCRCSHGIAMAAMGPQLGSVHLVNIQL